MDGDFLEGFENKTMSYSHHPGKVSRKLAEFDDEMIRSIEIVLKGIISNLTFSIILRILYYIS